jgi:hypothetical protein
VPLRGHYGFALLSQTFPPQTLTPCNTHLLSTRPSLLCEWLLAVTAVLCPYYNPSLPFSVLLPCYVNHYDPPAQHNAQLADL